MSSRLQEKEAARAARIAAEEADRAAARRRRRLRTLGLVIAGAVAIVVAAVVISTSGSDKATPKRSVAEINRTFAGIPQSGITLGRPDAPVTVSEFADLQCPFCRQFSENALPAVVRDRVRTGKARIVFRNLTFIGDDSVKAAKFAAAAGLQNRLWQVTEQLYANQGVENSGWVTDDALRSIGAKVPGLDVDKAFAAMESPAVARQIAAAKAEQSRYGVQGTPTFVVGPTGGKGAIAQGVTPPYDAGQLEAAIDQALKQASGAS